jgi:hypothetical protein
MGALLNQYKALRNITHSECTFKRTKTYANSYVFGTSENSTNTSANPNFRCILKLVHKTTQNHTVWMHFSNLYKNLCKITHITCTLKPVQTNTYAKSHIFNAFSTQYENLHKIIHCGCIIEPWLSPKIAGRGSSQMCNNYIILHLCYFAQNTLTSVRLSQNSTKTIGKYTYFHIW